jgi:hypothetical protein
MEVTVKAMLKHTQLPTHASKPVITVTPHKTDLTKAHLTGAGKKFSKEPSTM